MISHNYSIAVIRMKTMIILSVIRMKTMISLNYSLSYSYENND